jgi:hypothetical protein
VREITLRFPRHGIDIAFVLLQDQLGLTAIRPVETARYIHHLAQLTARGTGAAAPPDE